MERLLFYFKQNRLLSKGAPILIFVLCSFWTIYDFVTDDSMYFIKTGAVYGVMAMAVMSVAVFFTHLSVEKLDNTEVVREDEMIGALKRWCLVTTLYYVTIVIAASLVCGANNYLVYISGAAVTMQTISLSSTLLFLPAITPMPDNKQNAFLAVVIVGALTIPYFMQGSSCYAILPEIVLRAAMMVAYVVLKVRSEHNFALESKIKEGNAKTLEMLVNLIELRSLESGKHVNAVKQYTRIMLENLMDKHPEYELTPSMVRAITDASSTHDIGKILIPDEILLKPGSLSDEEFEVMKTHTEKGKAILDEVPEEFLGSDFIRYSKEICMYHHEKYDGGGYPAGLKGEEIPIWAQVVSIVDCYEALTSKRCYKDAYPHDIAVKMILDGECGAFSETMISCLKNCAEKFRELKASENVEQ